MRRIVEGLVRSLRAFGGVFGNPELRKLELAWAASIVGSWAYGIAVVVFAYRHGGAGAVGLVGLVRWVVAGVASPVAAVLGDRYDRRAVMVASDLARVVLIVAAAGAAFADAPAPFVYALTGLIAIAGSAFRPAEAAYTPTLARTPTELASANVVASTIESVGIFVGPALGGVLLAATSPATVFVVTSVLVLVSAMLIGAIRHPDESEPTRVSPKPLWEELSAGARAIAGERRLRVVVALFSAQTFVDGILGVLIVVLALRALHAGTAAVGYLNAAIGVGGLVGAVIAGAVVGRGRLAGDFAAGVALFGVPIALVAAWPNQLFALVLLGIVGVGNTLVDVAGMTLLQRAAPEAVLARVFGVLESLLLLSIGGGALAAPFLIDALGVRGTLVVAGLLLPLLAGAAWTRLAELDRTAEVPVGALELLRGIAIFAPLPEATLERLAHAATEQRAEPGEEIVRQGESGDRFYVVASGSVEATVDGEVVATLAAGDHFGEIALLRDVPRTATVRARERSVLYALGHDDFVPAVAGYAPSAAAAEAVIGLRLGPARAGIVRA